MDAVSKVKISKSKQNSNKNIFIKNVLSRKMYLHINEIGSNLKSNIEKKLRSEIEMKCNVEGYIKGGSIEVLTYSSGEVKGEYVVFNVNFECLICKPVEGTIIHNCIVKNNTKAGIRAELKDENPSPIIIFVSRDHNYSNENFSKLSENDTISVKIIGIRYELNDTNIYAIAELID